VDEAQRVRDRDTVERWVKAEGADLDNEARRAQQKLWNVDRARE
jgi:transposase-like protein